MLSVLQQRSPAGADELLQQAARFIQQTTPAVAAAPIEHEVILAT